MNKKILSLVIALVLVLGSVTTVFAGNFDLIHKLDSRKNTAMLELMEDLDVYDQVFEDFANYELEYESKKYALVDIQEKLDAGADGLQEAIEQIDKGEEPSGGLEVVEVSAINPTEIKVVFNQKVSKDTAEDLDYYYFGLTKGNVVNSKLISGLGNVKSNGANNGFKAVLLADGKTVIISAENDDKAGTLVTIWEDKNNVGATPLVIGIGEEKNIVKNKTAYIQVRDMRLANGKLADTVEGSFLAKDKTPADFADVKTNYDVNDKVEGVSVTFTEPVDLTNAKLYLDSRTLTDTTDYELSFNGKVLTIDNAKLNGKHTLEIVGLEDLAGNRVAGDLMTKVFEVKPLEDDEKPSVIPKVISLDQIHDGAFKVLFNTKVTADLTIKRLIADKDVNLNLTGETEVKDEDGKVVGYNYTVTFAEADDTNGISWADVYKTSNKIDRIVEITNIVSTDGKKAESNYSKAHTFVLDNIAPIVYGAVKVVDGPKVQINFLDKPFSGEMELDTTINGKVIIKQTIDGETKTVTLEANDALLVYNNETLEIDLTDTAFDTFKDDNNNKVKAGNYTISLPDGLVVDGAGTPDATPQFKYLKNALVGTTLSFEIKGDPNTGGASVPQTAQELVKYDNVEKAIVVRFVGEDIDASTATKTSNYTFAGKALDSDTEIEYETSKDILDDNSNVKGGIVRIYLKDNTVVRNGSYTLTVKNVATKSGAKMLPTTVTVDGLEDNTAPLLTKAVITGDGQIEITFNESIKGNYTKAKYNFQVLVGGVAIDIEEVNEKEDTDDRILVLHTTSTFDADKFIVEVATTEDVNGDVFITDEGGNKLAVGTVVTATKLK